ncbi:endonuclease/exonuclease/phosphatase family protein [Rubritalea sp.]|uniref:endonuclease/exonuclease/phosphatase family protein n=1 Tax=Rubritalea sp. TaxID=2109375 RepID=UPI003EF23582
MRQFKFSTPQALLCGVFFCLLLSGCDDQPESPDWPTTSEKPTSSSTVKKLTKTRHVTNTRTVFMVYNIKNYLSQPRGESMRSKPESEVLDLVENIIKVHPDILGICEIGTQADLNDLQLRLKTNGLDLPYSHLVGGADAYRRQALLSKLPLTPHNSANIAYQHEGKRHIILRGILDVSIELPCGESRFIGAHLKSKRENKYFDQAIIRRKEAQLIREHSNLVLTENPNVIVYGDFNDTKQSPSVRAVAGDHGSSNYLFPLNLADSEGQRWTHYWSHQDIYSRFDYAFASSSMKQHITLEESYIPKISIDSQASDHRPLVITFY